MTIGQATKLAKSLLSKHTELKSWSVTVNKRKTSFGLCDYGKKEIQLSSILVPVMNDEGIKDTILHEIAHALCSGHHHDKIWKSKYIELGGDGKRCHGAEKYKEGNTGRAILEEKIAKYTLTCPECGEKYHRNRKPTRASSCGKHNTRGFDLKYKLILTQNY